ncbi:hypothetical protein [Nocardia sp. NPDC057272]|uniref:hypothetical protein n=1 Tax=Nocardia sp. NPDC057272 TaxID=3346079 RepID=UPI00363B76E9
MGRSPLRDRASPVVLSARVVPADLGYRVGLPKMDRAHRRATPPVDDRVALRPARDRAPHDKAPWPADNSLRDRVHSSPGAVQGSRPVGRGRARDNPAMLLVLNNLQVVRAMRLVHNRMRVRAGRAPPVRPAGRVRRRAADHKWDTDRAVDPRRVSGRAVVRVRNSQVDRRRAAGRVARVRRKQVAGRVARVPSKQVDDPRAAGRVAWVRRKRGAGPVLSKVVDRTRDTDRAVAQVRSRPVDPVSRVEMPVRPVLGRRAGRAM